MNADNYRYAKRTASIALQNITNGDLHKAGLLLTELVDELQIMLWQAEEKETVKK